MRRSTEEGVLDHHSSFSAGFEESGDSAPEWLQPSDYAVLLLEADTRARVLERQNRELRAIIEATETALNPPNGGRPSLIMALRALRRGV